MVWESGGIYALAAAALVEDGPNQGALKGALYSGSSTAFPGQSGNLKKWALTIDKAGMKAAGREVKSVTGHGAGVAELQLTNDQRILLSACQTGDSRTRDGDVKVCVRDRSS